MTSPDDKVTADARELAEKVVRASTQFTTSVPGGKLDTALDEVAAILLPVLLERDQLRVAAVLAPVVARAEAAERERDRLRAKLASLDLLAAQTQTAFAAWHAAFGTTQLSHAIAERDQLRAEVERLTKKQPINTHVRLFDLVRFMRTELHAADLITNDEYAWLCQHTFPGDPKAGSPSPRRLEDYDDLRAQLAAARPIEIVENVAGNIERFTPTQEQVQGWFDELADARQAVAVAQAQAREAMEDKERLVAVILPHIADLEKCAVIFDGIGAPTIANGFCKTVTKLRAAIDQARQEEARHD